MEKLRYDSTISISPSSDLTIVLDTVKVILFGKGAEARRGPRLDRLER